MLSGSPGTVRSEAFELQREVEAPKARATKKKRAS